jgi:DNA-binding FadR family transcriptional regulator
MEGLLGRLNMFKSSRSQQLSLEIQDQLRRSALREGELFMTEAEVAAKYRVSRGVAREAVGRLQALGLLEGRRRKGFILRRPDPVRLFSAGLTSTPKSAEAMAELARLRYVLEIGAIELAVRNATDEQVAQLLEISGRITAAVECPLPVKAAEALDLAFHSLLLAMTGSQLVADMQRVLIEFFDGVVIDPKAAAEDANRIAWEHAELAAAIRDRDVERSRSMLRLQLRRYLPDFESGGPSEESPSTSGASTDRRRSRHRDERTRPARRGSQ